MSYQQGLSQFILHNNACDLNTLFEGSPDTSIASIYRNGFFRSCREVLTSTFPSTQSFAGEELFNALAHAFIQAYPPDTGTLTGYGDKFPIWVASQTIEENPLLAQLARLDWSWIACLHGHDATPLTAKLFQSLLAEDSNVNLPSISLIKNTQLIASNERAIHLWLNLKKDVAVKDIDLNGTTNPQAIIMWRPELDVFIRPLQTDEASYLEEILYCKNLNDASANTLNKNPGFNLPEQFSALLQHGLLSINRDSHDA